MLPVARSVAIALGPFVVGRGPDDSIYPKSYSAQGCDLWRLGGATGIDPVSAHEFRRSIGRILYYERQWVVNAIRVLYGHSSAEMTLY